MSAINPASFASPTLGIQAPSGIGPGAVGVGRGGSGGGERRQNPPQEQQQQQQPQQQSFGRGFRPAFGQPFAVDRNVPPSAYPQANYAYGSGAFGNARNAGPYAPSLSPGADAFGGAFPQPGDFQALRQRFPGGQPLPGGAPHSQGISPISPQGDWTAAFQSLSLNTH